MILDFARDRAPDLLTTQALAQQARQGDLALILNHYEQDLKSPIRGLLMGDLVRLVLIQVQRSKVDLETAMLALDKLLKSNELNFELLAVLPVVALLWLGFGRAREAFRRLRKRSLAQVRGKIQNILW